MDPQHGSSQWYGETYTSSGDFHSSHGNSLGSINSSTPLGRSRGHSFPHSRDSHLSPGHGDSFVSANSDSLIAANSQGRTFQSASSHLSSIHPPPGHGDSLVPIASFPSELASGGAYRGSRGDGGLNNAVQSLAPRKFREIDLLPEFLGEGSYGVVHMAKCDRLLTCAAKVIHTKLLTENPTSRSPQERFIMECMFLSSLRHPNVVQYLGTHVNERQQLMLLMELMDGNLTHYLEKSELPLPFRTQVNICHDISLALAFLHLNGIIHRDLSSNNVLMIGDRRAKVTDFGMATWQRHGSLAGKYTTCPGTVVYMPPEALDEDNSLYTNSIDCFSLGVLALQVVTRLFPVLSKRHVDIPTENGSQGIKIVQVVSELERRTAHIIMANGHAFLDKVRECLSNDPIGRPSAVELCLYFENQKTRDVYRLSRACSGSSPMNMEGGLQREALSDHQADLQRALSDHQAELQRASSNHQAELQRALSGYQAELQRVRNEFSDREASLIEAKDKEILFYRGKLDRQQMDSQAEIAKSVESIQHQLKEKDEIVLAFEKQKMSALMDMEESKLELRQEKDHHKATMRLLEETLESDRVYQDSINPTLSLPNQRSFAQHAQRRRSWSTSCSAEKVTFQKQSSLIFDLLGESGRPCAGEGVMSVSATLNPLSANSESFNATVSSSYQVSFVPKTRGRHRLSLKINGTEARSSEIFIEEPMEKIQDKPLKIIRDTSLKGVFRITVNQGLLYSADQKHEMYHILDLRSNNIVHSQNCKLKITGIAVGTDGIVYVTSKHRVNKISPNGERIGSFGGTSLGSNDVSLDKPNGLAILNNHIHICDSGNGRIVVVNSADLRFVKHYGKGISQLKIPKSVQKPGHLQNPVDIAFCDDKAYVLDAEKKAIVIFKNFVYQTLFSVEQLAAPDTLCFRGGDLLVTDWPGKCFGVYSKSGGPKTWKFVRKINTGCCPVGICIDEDGYIYIANNADNTVLVY